MGYDEPSNDDVPSHAEAIGHVRNSAQLARDHASAALYVAEHDQQVVAVGEPAPLFVLPDGQGVPVALEALLGKGALVVTFYRGIWCPYCNQQLLAYQRALPTFRRAGGELLAISPQLPDATAETVVTNRLAFRVLSDVGNVVAEQFGLVVKFSPELRARYLSWDVDLAAFNGDASWELPLAATFILDRRGMVRQRFISADPTVRMKPAAVLAVLRALQAEPHAAEQGQT